MSDRHWRAQTPQELQERILSALGENTGYQGAEAVLGFPGSSLDSRIFHDAPFLEHAPYLRCLKENPNHIGVHTLTQGETPFVGTQHIERELLDICAEQLMEANSGDWDGYVATGGTEANIQALWVLRNFFRRSLGATLSQICILHSEDTHYSIAKAADLLVLQHHALPVDPNTRTIRTDALEAVVATARDAGIRFFIVVLNLGTTMFGSVDDIEGMCEVLDRFDALYRIHVDAAFGGFIYPLTGEDNPLSFRDPRVTSITMDAHKMLQAPYGTGIFLIRKGYLEHVRTESAHYVHGGDYTLCGSRSGAAAVAVWMILNAYGSHGGAAFCMELIRRTDRLCQGLSAAGLRFFRHPRMNVVAIRAEDISESVATRFHLVPDRHDGEPLWWKIVVMEHVTDALFNPFLEALTAPDEENPP